MNLGVFLLRKLKEAIDNHARQKAQFAELLEACSESESAKTDKWDLAIQEWEEDHSKPDPYDESEYGVQYKNLLERCTLTIMFHSRNTLRRSSSVSEGGGNGPEVRK